MSLSSLYVDVLTSPTISKEADEILARLDDARKASSNNDVFVYNMTTGEQQTLLAASLWATEKGHARFVDPAILIAGDEERWAMIEPVVSFRKNVGKPDDFFKQSHDDLIISLRVLIPVDAVIALHNSSKAFRAVCEEHEVFKVLIEANNIFSEEDRSMNDYDRFCRAWVNRIDNDTVHTLDFSGQPIKASIGQITKFIDSCVESANALCQNIRGFDADKVCTSSMVDVLFISQYPRNSAVLSTNHDINFVMLLEEFNKEERFVELFDEVRKKHPKEGMLKFFDQNHHEDYLKLLKHLCPSFNLPTDEWFSRINKAIAMQIRRLKTFSDNGDQMAKDDLTKLLRIFGVQRKCPYLFWLWCPDVEGLRSALENAWIELLDQRARLCDDEDVKRRLHTYQNVQRTKRQTQTIEYYNVDFDERYTAKQVEDLKKRKLLTSNDIDEEDCIIGDITRFNNIWMTRFESVSIIGEDK